MRYIFVLFVFVNSDAIARHMSNDLWLSCHVTPCHVKTGHKNGVITRLSIVLFVLFVPFVSSFVPFVPFVSYVSRFVPPVPCAVFAGTVFTD